MKRIWLYLLFSLSLLPAVKAQTVVSIHIDATINPSTAEFIHRAIAKAENKKAECLIIHLNTPGGLLKSTRNIVGDIMESSVPVVVYISPAGADAGSAGVFITLSANIAAMAPGTNIGAAHPVTGGEVDSIMYGKITNDAAAFIRTIAKKRNRNIEWADNAVRRSYSYSETEALQDSVIDLIAKNDAELLKMINGKKVELNSGEVTLRTASAKIENYEMGFIEKLLNIISDPNIAYMLMMLGFLGIIFELFNPGAIFPGIVGVIALIFGFYAMSNLPVNYAGLSLIIFGIILFVLEIKVVSHGLLSIGGVISILLGSLFLFRTSPEENFISISWTVIFAATSVTALFFLFVAGMGLKAQRTKPVIGIDTFIGKKGEAVIALEPKGIIKINGEIWNAISLSAKIDAGEKIIVREIKNLTLYVEKA